MENKLDEKLINHILESLKKDYEVGNCYREDSVKSCLYFSIRSYFLEENEKIEELESKIFVYPEIRNKGKRFDLVISKGYLENYSNDDIKINDNKAYTEIKGYELVTDIIEIKYIKGTEKQITDSLENDFKKLLEVEENNIKSKNIFFIYEYNKRNEDYIKNVKDKILEIGDTKNFIEKIKNSKLKNSEKEEYIKKIKNTKVKINIFGLFVDLSNSYKIDFFKNWEK